MAKYYTSPYGTKIDITGLTAAQVAKVKAQADAKYGTKAAALASSYRKQAGGTTPTTSTPSTAPKLGINDKTGAINSAVATGTVMDAANQDTSNNFNLNNPGSQTDAMGNTQTITRDPVTGAVSLSQQGGSALSAANQAFTSAAGGIANGRNEAQNAAYSYITKDYGQSKAREQEAAKQELAQRGIPIDPSPESLWSKTLQGIDQKYQSLDDQAKNQAIGAGNQTYATNTAAVGTLAGATQAMTPNFTPYQGAQSNNAANLQQLLSTISAADMTKYGIDQDMQAKLKALAAAKSGGGGGGSNGGGSTSPIIGGVAP
jgi:hypothetical protein